MLCLYLMLCEVLTNGAFDWLICNQTGENNVKCIEICPTDQEKRLLLELTNTLMLPFNVIRSS